MGAHEVGDPVILCCREKRRREVRAARLSWGRGYALYLEELPVPLSDHLEAAVQQLNEAMEHTIRQCPQQYLWGYARYKQPRREASPAGGEA
jgi:lauroyl/myristoyl acyltransferase